MSHLLDCLSVETPFITGIHPYLAETNTVSRLEWIYSLDKLESLKPRAVIAGHKVPENPDEPRIISETRQYLRDFNRLDEVTATARELYDAMLELYPGRANPGSLLGWRECREKMTVSLVYSFLGLRL